MEEEIKVGDTAELTSVDSRDCRKGLQVGYRFIVKETIKEGVVDDCCNIFYFHQVKKVQQEEKKMNRKEIEAKIKELQQQLDSLPKWPIEGEMKHYVYYDGYHGGEVIDYECELSNLSDTIKESDAKKLYMKQLLLRDMVNYVAVMHPDWEPDWSNIGEEKWGITSRRSAAEVVWCTNNTLVFGISVPTIGAAEDMFKVFKDRIEEWY